MIWEKNEHLNCSFEQLFEPIDNIGLVSTNSYLSYYLYYRDRRVSGLKTLIKKKLYNLLSKNYQFFDDSNIQKVAYNHDYWNESRHDFVIHSCIDFYSPELRNASSFKPVLKLQNLINKEVSKFSKPTTGIHIRRTDNTKSIDKSATDLFLKQIDQSLNIDDNQFFYVATDDEKEESFLKSAFGEHILTQENKELNRNSPKGIEDALVDLYSLSQTKIIWGSYWSSFSKTAAGLTQIPLKIIA